MYSKIVNQKISVSEWASDEGEHADKAAISQGLNKTHAKLEKQFLVF